MGELPVASAAYGGVHPQFMPPTPPPRPDALQYSLLALSVSPDCKWIATGNQDATLHVWRLGRSGDELSRRGHPRKINALRVQPTHDVGLRGRKRRDGLGLHRCGPWRDPHCGCCAVTRSGWSPVSEAWAAACSPGRPTAASRCGTRPGAARFRTRAGDRLRCAGTPRRQRCAGTGWAGCWWAGPDSTVVACPIDAGCIRPATMGTGDPPPIGHLRPPMRPAADPDLAVWPGEAVAIVGRTGAASRLAASAVRYRTGSARRGGPACGKRHHTARRSRSFTFPNAPGGALTYLSSGGAAGRLQPVVAARGSHDDRDAVGTALAAVGLTISVIARQELSGRPGAAGPAGPCWSNSRTCC